MFELIGIIGGALFAAGCIPMAFKTWKLGRDLGTPLETQWLLFLACMFYSVYLFGEFGYTHLPFWFLAIEVLCWGIAVWYHYFPRTGRSIDTILEDVIGEWPVDTNGVVEDCTRQHGHAGPCNGWPLPGCHGYKGWRDGIESHGHDRNIPGH